ncbi:hypothetical protein C4E22_03595 [ANME-1 cluster archaeon AG-394-G06]|nr:hypothetical protein [ANME-1 cluster archaeon AG-394-G06]
MVAWSGVKKGERIYSFEGDLTFEEYIELLEKYFSIQKIIEAPDFAGYPLSNQRWHWGCYSCLLRLDQR